MAPPSSAGGLDGNGADGRDGGVSSRKPMGLREKVMKGGTFMMLRQLISMGLSLVGVLLITRVIGPGPYGAYAAALGIYQYAQNLGQAGIGVFLVRSPGQPSPRDYHVATTLLLLLAVLLVCLLEAGAGLLARWVNVDGFDVLLAVLALALPFETLAVTASAQLERVLDFRRVAIIEMSGQVVSYLVAIPLVYLGFGPWSLVAGYGVQQAGMCVAFHVSAGYRPRLAWDGEIARRIFGYTLGFTASNWLWQLRNLVNPLIVGHFLGAEAVGLIGLGIRLMEMLAFAKTVAWRLSVAALARVQDSNAKLVEATTHGMQLQMLAIGPVLLGFGWAGVWIIPLLFGARWAPVMEVYPFIALSYLTNALFNVHSSVLYVRRRNWDVSYFHVLHVSLFAAGTWMATSRWGLVGYGWGEVAGLGAYLLLHVLVARQIGSPDYRIAALWWAGVTVGLFWQQLGLWTAAVPFLALAWPGSIRQLRSYVQLLRGRHAHAA